MNAIGLGKYELAREHLAQSLKIGLAVGNHWGATYPLHAFGTLAVAERRYEHAALLFGASEGQRLQLGLVPQTPEHTALRAVMAAASDFVGSDLDSVRQAGRELDFGDAVALAL